jgi:hypothetical protein
VCKHAQSNHIPTPRSPKPKTSDPIQQKQLIRKTWPPKVSQATRTGKSRYGSPPYLQQHHKAMSDICVCQTCSRHRVTKNKNQRRTCELEWPGRDADSSERSEPMPEWDVPSPITSSRRCELGAASHRRIGPRKARSNMHTRMPHEPKQWAPALRPRSVAP